MQWSYKVDWHRLSPRVGFGSISVLELHLSKHTEYRLLCDNHHSLQILLGRLCAAGLPAEPPCSSNSDGPMCCPPGLLACTFWMLVHSLEVFKSWFALVSRCKGALSVRHNFHRSKKEPSHPFPTKDISSLIKVTLRQAEQDSVPLPPCFLSFLGAFLSPLW